MTPYRSSASQVSKAELCLRKWGFPKLDGIKATQNRYAAFGSTTHRYLEEWFVNRTPPPANIPEGRTALLIIGELPPPQTPGIEIEKEIRLTLGGIPFKGCVDFRILAQLPRPFVSDHKTCGNFNYALTPDTMKDDIAATIYAYDAMCLTNEEAVDLQWTYGQRNGKKVLPVCAIVTLDEIKPRLERTATTAKLLRDITEEHPKAIELPYDAAGCEAFGGCPFKKLCNLTPSERIRSIMAQGEAQKDWKKKLLNRKAARAGEPLPHPELADEAPEPHPAPADAAPINPPDAPPPEPAPAPAAAPSAPARRGRPKKTDAQKAADKALKDTAKAAAATQPAPPAAVVPEAPPAGIVDVLIDKWRDGFLAGFKLGREEK